MRFQRFKSFPCPPLHPSPLFPPSLISFRRFFWQKHFLRNELFHYLLLLNNLRLFYHHIIKQSIERKSVWRKGGRERGGEERETSSEREKDLKQNARFGVGRCRRNIKRFVQKSPRLFMIPRKSKQISSFRETIYLIAKKLLQLSMNLVFFR